PSIVRAETYATDSGDPQRPCDVGQREGVIAQALPVLDVPFLCADQWWAEPEVLSVGTQQVHQAPGAGLDHLGQVRVVGRRGTGASQQLGQVDRVRLVPQQERADVARRLAEAGADVVGPEPRTPA